MKTYCIDFQQLLTQGPRSLGDFIHEWGPGEFFRSGRKGSHEEDFRPEGYDTLEDAKIAAKVACERLLHHFQSEPHGQTDFASEISILQRHLDLLS